MKHSDVINNTQAVSDYIPFSSLIDDQTIVTKDGALMTIFRIAGAAFETKGSSEVTLQKARLNSFLKGLAEHPVSIWTHVVRYKKSVGFLATYDDDFSKTFNEKYQKDFASDVRVNELYLTLIYHPPFNKLLKKDAATYKNELLEKKEALDGLVAAFNNHFESYGIEQLGAYPSPNGKDYTCSEPLRFLNFLMTGQWSHIRTPNSPLDSVIGNAWIEMGRETIALRSPSGIRYCQGIDIKEYSNTTYSGMLNGLLFADVDFVLTQSWSLLPKKKAKGFVTLRERFLKNAKDDGISQIDALVDAKNELNNGDIALGEYHFCLNVFGESPKDTTKNRAKLANILSDLEILPATIDIATDAAFFAQLPANWRYRPRVAGLTSLNVAGLSPFNNFFTGKPEKNPWGQAVTQLKTLSGQPFYFNHHVTKLSENSLGKKVLGNTLVIGQSGTGKSVLLATLLLQSQKFAQDDNFSTVFFDKDRGAEALIRATGGTYFALKNGKESGLNPFSLDATAENLTFLKSFCRLLVKRSDRDLEPFEEQMISRAVDQVMAFPKEKRCLTRLNEHLTVSNDRASQSDSIKLRLKKWLRGGEFGWVFDNDVDTFDFNVSRNIGVDGTEFLDNDDVRSPISYYLLHRMQQVIDGRRFVYYMDEAWKWLDDPIFSEFADNKQLTIRKQNGLGVFATQMPSSFLESEIAASLVQQCPTKIFLPNPNAKPSEYIEGFGLTETEYRIVLEFDEKSRLCLIKQGQQSVICSLEIGDSMADERTVMSSGTDELPFLEDALKQHGNNPKKWIPAFLQSLKDRD